MLWLARICILMLATIMPKIGRTKMRRQLPNEERPSNRRVPNLKHLLKMRVKMTVTQKTSVRLTTDFELD